MKVIDGNQIKKRKMELYVAASIPHPRKRSLGASRPTTLHHIVSNILPQTANAFFVEPIQATIDISRGFVDCIWRKSRYKGTRRNGKSEVTRIEPELKAIFDRIFGAQDIDDANPRNKVKQDKELTGGTGG